MTAIGSEESERLNGLLHGPWHKISNLARKFLRPATDFSWIVATDELIDLREFPLTNSDIAREGAIKWVLAPHWENAGPNTFKIKNSEGIRDSFDEALTTMQLLEIGIETGYIDLSAVRVLARKELTDLLWSASARRFIRAYEYTAPFFLARRVGVKLSQRTYRPPKPDPSASIRFATFLSQLPLWYSDSLLDQWQAFLDDYVDLENEQNRFWDFLKTGHEKNRGATKFSQLIIGADRFVMHLSNLFEFLEPKERPLIGQFFSYYIAKFLGYSLDAHGYRRAKNGVNWARAIGRSPLLGADLDLQFRNEVRDRFNERVEVIRLGWGDIREHIRKTLPG